jgi:tRNA threonylcarbamoyl adenosine modification protein YjeE
MKGHSMTTVTTRSAAETERAARHLAAYLKAGDCLTLSGELGAGKTTFARALIRTRAGAEIDVPSPTFSLVEAYDFDIPLHHVDLYRLESPDQAVELGLEELFDTGIVIIEWPERAAGLLPNARCGITIGQGQEDMRILAFEPRGEAWARRIETILPGLTA